jgi:hypothetical protein
MGGSGRRKNQVMAGTRTWIGRCRTDA